MERIVTVYLHGDDFNYREEYKDELKSGEMTENDIEMIKNLTYEVELQINLDTGEIKLIK